MCSDVAGAALERLNALADTVALAAGEVLALEGEPARHLFNVTAGSLRVYKLLPDGRRQITGFLFAGDFLGLAGGETFGFTAEAMEASRLCRFRRAEYQALVRDTPALERTLLTRTSHELAAAQNQMLLLGRKTAQERVASFLLDLPSHDPSRSAPENHVRLPMTRAEIADYLGLTIETVSRVLSRLKASGVVRLVSLHELQVLRPDQLQAIASGEG
ncbi:helix-turn-helix domain-containing protein [Brevundimonas sp. PAMC22021]|uniref:helix-turn-helix domain-containing protein n=1 Tax=Brevundimonas sp. PAMC22021 TaxID=2861285 RepID=UPI0021025217|nr:helix-turn-helix domain-containing protein [Brevundimonas sp. PAMC22021]